MELKFKNSNDKKLEVSNHINHKLKFIELLAKNYDFIECEQEINSLLNYIEPNLSKNQVLEKLIKVQKKLYINKIKNFSLKGINLLDFKCNIYEQLNQIYFNTSNKVILSDENLNYFDEFNLISSKLFYTLLLKKVIEISLHHFDFFIKLTNQNTNNPNFFNFIETISKNNYKSDLFNFSDEISIILNSIEYKLMKAIVFGNKDEFISLIKTLKEIQYLEYDSHGKLNNTINSIIFYDFKELILSGKNNNSNYLVRNDYIDINFSILSCINAFKALHPNEINYMNNFIISSKTKIVLDKLNPLHYETASKLISFN